MINVMFKKEPLKKQDELWCSMLNMKSKSMRKVCIYFMIQFVVMASFSQNGSCDGKYFLLLNNRDTVSLNLYDNNQIVPVKKFPVNEKTIFTTDYNNWVAVLDTSCNRILLYEIETSKEFKLEIPYNLKPRTILITGENLFIGGEIGTEMLLQYQIKSNTWYILDIPSQISMPGKAVDDLLVNDSLLMAVDDIVMPKYILFYRLNNIGKVRYSHYLQLKSNGCYEQILFARLSGNYLGLNSQTFSSGGRTNHITIFKNLDFGNGFSVRSNLFENNFQSFTDFVIIGDKVIIASEEKGLGVLKIKDSYFTQNKENNYFNRNVQTSMINYRYFYFRRIIKITIIPNTSKIVLTIKKTEKKYKQEVLEF